MLLRAALKNILRFSVLALVLTSNRFSDKVDQITSTLENKSQFGIEVISLKTGKVVYAKNSHVRQVPASAAKLFAVAAAFDLLGADYQFETELYLDRHTLILVGSGDPSLEKAHLEKLISSDLPEIKELIIDATAYDDVRSAPGWMWDDLSQRWNPPLSALVVDRSLTDNMPVIEPTEHTARTFAKLLGFSGKVSYASLPPNAKLLASHKSEPLSELAKNMLKESDNFYTDALFKKLGEVKYGKPGSWQNGSKAVRDFLSTKVGLDAKELVLLDGCGLSRYNLVSPHQLTLLLKWIYEESAFKEAFGEAVSIGGIDGTLKERFDSGRFRGKVRAKTGTMTGVSAIAGYLETKSKEPLAFTIMTSGFVGPCRDVKKEVEDSILNQLLFTPYD